MTRKHKGINQKTGRLNKGYKYSGKKLKSGLKQIIKVKQQKGGKVKQKGGKVMGKGGFGCAIAPAITCGKKSSRFEKRISKITYYPDESEITIGKKLKKIDRKGKYLIYVQEHCKIKKEQIPTIDFKKCGLKEKKSYDNLILKKGKGSLYDLENKMSLEANVKSLYKIICACMLLSKYNYAHFDIKDQNIVIARPRIGMGKYESYLIDFGGDYLIDSWSSFKKNILTFDVPYHFPPEVHAIMPYYIKKTLDNKDFFIISKSLMLELKMYSELLMKKKTGYKKYMDKVMVYLVGNSFSRIPLLKRLREKDPRKRLTLNEVKNHIEKSYPYVKTSVSFNLLTKNQSVMKYGLN